MSHNQRARVVIAGTISNVSKEIKKDLKKVVESFKDFHVIKIILVESDSTDNTIKTLRNLEKNYSNLEYISLGKLRTQIPNRIERIRYCRREYMALISKLSINEKIDYVVVADLDGMNRNLNSNSIKSCFERDGWDAVVANQTFGYYDVFALRCFNWLQTDCFEDLRELQNALNHKKNKMSKLRLFFEFDECRKKAIYSKMRRIPRKSEWIEIQSGFGGLGIYKSELFLQSNYNENSITNSIKSEHIAFCENFRGLGGRIFINPKLINNHINTYNINRITFIRLIRILYWDFKKKSKK